MRVSENMFFTARACIPHHGVSLEPQNSQRKNLFSFLLSPAEKECLQRDKRAEKKMMYALVIHKNHSRALKSIYSNIILMLPKGLWFLFSFLSKENKKINSAFSAPQR